MKFAHPEKRGQPNGLSYGRRENTVSGLWFQRLKVFGENFIARVVETKMRNNAGIRWVDRGHRPHSAYNRVVKKIHGS